MAGNTKNSLKSLGSETSQKSNILILGGGQSNIGTVDPATGRVAYADMPSYLSATPTNIKYINTSNALATWAPDPALEWGWLNQTLYILSQEYTNIIYSKHSNTLLNPPIGPAIDATAPPFTPAQPSTVAKFEVYRFVYVGIPTVEVDTIKLSVNPFTKFP